MTVLLIIIGIIVLIIAAVLIRCAWELKQLVVTDYTLRTSKLPAGDRVRALFISDLHGRSYGENNEIFVEMVRKAAPDMILIGGDLLVSNDESIDQRAMEVLDRINGIAPIYYARGNHEKAVAVLDIFQERNEKFCRYLDEKGIICLDNRSVDAGRNITVTGLDIDYSYYSKLHPVKMETGVIQSYVGKSDKASYNIMLAHNPKYFEQYQEFGADLILAGHFHGGTVRLPGIGGIISPQFRLFPKYSKGRFEENGSTMIVSGGCGSHTINFRIFNKPELLLINIEGE